MAISHILSTLAVLAIAIGTPVKFANVDRGQHSNIDEQQQVTIKTAAEWTKLWQQHAYPRPKPPVDFARLIVIGIFLGSRPTGGFDVEITSIEQEAADMVVTWRESRPERGAILSQVLTMPYHLVSLPKTSGTVTFKKAT